jgi:Putative Flp pilus-assembly TadE/G-like
MRCRFATRRRGVVIVLVALCLTAMIGIVAIALDGSLLLDQRRGVQAAADAAALAAAIDLYKNYLTNNGLDPNGTARASGFSVAAANGYNNDGKRSLVDIHVPPGSGIFAGKPGYAEALIVLNQERGFSQIFGSGSIQVKARAVAGGLLKPLDKGIILLDPTGVSLNAVGNAVLDVTSGAIVVDSTNSAAGTLVGNAIITAPTIDFGGTPGYSLSGNAKFGAGTTVASSQPAVVDPLAYLQPPNPSSFPLQSSSTLKITGKNPVTLNPGLYIGGISISGQGNVTMNPGIYYLQAGGFSDTGQGSLLGNGVMLYNDNGGGTINISGQGQVTISPPTSGPYQGISIFQDRSSSAAISVTGNGNTNITGTFYAANALLNIKGNGTGNNIGSQYVSYDLKVTGNGDINITYESSSAPKVRVFGLVE